MINCPKCNRPIGEEDFNVATDYACCRNCKEVYRFSELMEESIDPLVNFDTPPRGISLRDDGMGEVMWIRHYSHGAWVLLLFALFWCGITMAVTTAFLRERGLWNVENLFFVPFILVGLLLIVVFLYMLIGHSELRFHGDTLVLFSGIGPIGIRRVFDASMLKSIRLEETGTRVNNVPVRGVYAETGQGRKKVFSSTEGERLEFVAAYLRRRQPKGRRKF